MRGHEYTEALTSAPLRKLTKSIEANLKETFDLRMTGPIKPTTQYGGLHKPIPRV